MGYVTVERDTDHPETGLESHLCDLGRVIAATDRIVSDLLDMSGKEMQTPTGADKAQDLVGQLAVMMGIVGEFAGAAKDEFYVAWEQRKAAGAITAT